MPPAPSGKKLDRGPSPTPNPNTDPDRKCLNDDDRGHVGSGGASPARPAREGGTLPLTSTRQGTRKREGAGRRRLSRSAVLLSRVPCHGVLGIYSLNYRAALGWCDAELCCATPSGKRAESFRQSSWPGHFEDHVCTFRQVFLASCRFPGHRDKSLPHDSAREGMAPEKLQERRYL
jgi:hypothetical protein